MFRLRALSVFSLMTLMVLGAEAQFAGQPGGGFQPKVKAPPAPLITTIMPYLGSEDLQKELKLTQEQVKRLIEFRQKQWDLSYNTAAKDLNAEEMYKAVVAEFKDTLTAEQLTRAHQIAAQRVWTTPAFRGDGPTGPEPDYRIVSSTLITRSPELATALKLNETQTKLAASTRPVGGGKAGADPFSGGFAGTSTTILLTPEQTAAAKKWIGATFTGKMLLERDPRAATPFALRVTMPVALNYTAAKDVQKELALTEAQLADLTKLRAKWPRNTFGQLTSTLSPAEQKKANDELLAETNKELEKILTADQRKRIAQIQRQQTSPAVMYREGNALGKELGITEAQQKKYAEVVAAHGETVVKAVLSGDPLEKVKAAVEAASADEQKAIDAILTPEQQAKGKELFGEPFKGNTFGDAGPGGGGGGGAIQLQDLREVMFGRYAGELVALTRYEGVRKELKMSEEQVKKASEALTALNEKLPTLSVLQSISEDKEKAAKLYADRSEIEQKALADILDKDQQARFRQLRIQQLEDNSGFARATTSGAVGYPGVADAVKLTADQKKKILAGDEPNEVLTADQKKLIKDMMGKTVDVAEMFNQGRPPGVGQPTARATLPAGLALVLTPRMWEVIKITPEQYAKLVEPINAYRLATVRSNPFGGPGAGAATGPQEAIDTFSKEVEGILSAAQRKRLDQLAVQSAAATSLVTALVGTERNPSVRVKALGITEDQVKAIRAASSEMNELANLLDTTSLPFTKLNEVGLALRDKLDARIVAILNNDQKAKWKEMNGEPYDGFTKQPLGGRFGGGGGGRGGLGGGGGF